MIPDKVYLLVLIVLFTLVNLILLGKVNLNYTESAKQIENSVARNDEISIEDIFMSNPQTKKRVYWPDVYNYNSQNDGLERSAWNRCMLKTLGLIDGNTEGGGVGAYPLKVELDIELGRLVLRPIEDGDEGKGLTIAHGAECPFYALEASRSLVHQDLQVDTNQFPHFKAGVSVLVEDHRGRVFLTKRAETMRIFPSIWVLPGGHTEKGETFADTGAREVKEETGIDLSSIKDQMKMIGVFESAYPNYLEAKSLPMDHHIVIYMYIKLPADHPVELKLQQSEVSISAWLPRSFLLQFIPDELPGNFAHVAKPASTEDEPVEIIYPKDYKGPLVSSDSLKQQFTAHKEYISTGAIYILKEYLNSTNYS